MSYGRSRLYDRNDVAEKDDVSSATVSRRLPQTALTAADAAREINALRSINADLVHQLAVLRQREAHAQRLADRDGLTGLYNRRRMLELLDASMGDGARAGHRVGLLFIDLDGFKGVNDDFGHAAGDQLLVTVAARISARARTGDFVCRYGGDEFVVILPRVADMSAMNHVAASIRKRVTLPCRIDGIEMHVTASIGAALYPDHARNASTLMTRADASMYRAKAHAADHSDSRHRPTVPSRRRDDRLRR